MARKLRHSLFYTKQGELDFGWLILVLCTAVGLVVFVAQSFGWIRGPSTAAWAWFGSFTGLAFIAGAAISRARLIAKSRLPGEIASGVAQSATERWGGPATRWFDPDAGVSPSDPNDPSA